MNKRVTLIDIAQKVGVSNVAVHKALNDKPGVSDEMRARIKQVAQEMGYQGTVAAKQEPAKMIGVVIPESYYGFSGTFYGQLYEKVVKALQKYNSYGILELLTPDMQKNKIKPQMVQDHRIEGLILMGIVDEQYVNMIQQEVKLPVVFLDTYFSTQQLDTVISDGYYGTYMLTSRLISLGHRKIAFVGSVDKTSSIADRYYGYRRALRESGIEFIDKWEIPDRDDTGYTSEHIITQIPDCTAYVCNCDMTADIVIGNLEKFGIRVPEDISVVGFDNIIPAGFVDRNITTYEVNIDRMAELSVMMIINKINHDDSYNGIQIVSGRMIEKSTMAAAKNTQT